MLQTEIDKLNARLQAPFNQKRLLAHGVCKQVKTDEGQLLYDATDTSRPVTLEDWPDAQVFYVLDDSRVEVITPRHSREAFDVTAVIYTTLPEFREFFLSQIKELNYEYTGSQNNEISIVNQFLPGLPRWNHERELYALNFTITLPVKTEQCVTTCF